MRLPCGTQQRDFCYISDLVDAVVTVALSGDFDGQIYNVASGRGAAIGDILAMLSERLGAQPDIRWSGAARPGEPQRWVGDVTRLQGLGWQPLVPLNDGLDRTIAWFQQNS